MLAAYVAHAGMWKCGVTKVSGLRSNHLACLQFIENEKNATKENKCIARVDHLNHKPINKQRILARKVIRKG